MTNNKQQTAVKLNFKGYTARQYAVLIMREDFSMTIRQIAKRINLSESAVGYILHMKK
jgi:DNA-directed RNA polymerase specialized sigma24 family protein